MGLFDAEEVGPGVVEPDAMGNLYKIFIFAGAGLIVIGLGLFVLQKFHIPLGRLPGDIVITKERFTFYFPIATSIAISILLTLIFYLWKR